ncbi:putative SP-containing protein [Vairimorpha necatrix]|uniref:SP-containing protein n=1 Tax=Vairimorpha necatrix TaxID=6039 RepID=A0AAX4J9H5_9MICR
MIFIFTLPVYFCHVENIETPSSIINNDIETNEAYESLKENTSAYSKYDFDDLFPGKNQDINLDNFSIVTRDMFSVISQHSDISERLRKIVSKNKNPDKSFIFTLYNLYLQELHLGFHYNSKCSNDYSYIKSLSNNSYKLIKKLACLGNFNDYLDRKGIIKYHIFKSIDLKYDDICKNNITQLFNTKKYKMIDSMLNRLYVKEFFRDKRYVLPRMKTTIKPFAPDDVKIVYMPRPQEPECRGYGRVCIPESYYNN